GHVDHLGVAVDLHPRPEVVRQHDDAHERVATRVLRLGPLRVRRHDDAALVVDPARDRGALGSTVAARREDDRTVTRTHELEQPVAVDRGVGRDLRAHARSSFGTATTRERTYSPRLFAWASNRVDDATPSPSSPTITKLSAWMLGSS